MAIRAFAEKTVQYSVPEAKTPAKRVTLSIVPAVERETNKVFRIRYIIGALIVISGFMVILTNVQISKNQYELVTLNAELNALSQTNSGLAEQTQYLGSPQVLSKKALELGMVSPGAAGVINVSEGTATHGEPSTGDKPEKGILNLPEKPAQPKPIKQPAYVAPAVVETPVVEEVEASVVESKPVEIAQPVETTKDGRPVFNESALNGGTIPAPSLRIPTK